MKLPQNSSYETEIKTAVAELKRASLLECLNCIQGTLCSKLPTQKFAKKTDVYRLVLHEFSELCDIYMNLNRCEISPDLSEIILVTLDASNRKHEVTIGVDYSKNENQIFYIKNHHLPKDCVVKGGASLKVICEKFLFAIRSLQQFWDVMDDFDRRFWILDPEKPDKEDVYRRVSLGEVFVVQYVFFFIFVL